MDVTSLAMQRLGVPSSDSLSAGVIAAGGTLGILIPPSMVLVIYGIITSQDIGRLFLAGIIPGLLGIIGYIIAVKITLWYEKKSNKQKLTPLPTIEKIKALN